MLKRSRDHVLVRRSFEGSRFKTNRTTLGHARRITHQLSQPVWKSTSASGAPHNSSLSHFSAMALPSWLGRAVRNEHHHAIEQASRRWRGGRRDDSARTRREFLISTQVSTSSRSPRSTGETSPYCPINTRSSPTTSPPKRSTSKRRRTSKNFLTRSRTCSLVRSRVAQRRLHAVEADSDAVVPRRSTDGHAADPAAGPL
jgi:hypothetical protein